jgi:hypothetical protein
MSKFRSGLAVFSSLGLSFFCTLVFAQTTTTAGSAPGTPAAPPASCQAGTNFTKQAVLYVSSSLPITDGSCDWRAEDQVKHNAEDAAMAACYQAGFDGCSVKISYLSKNGQLDCKDIKTENDCNHGSIEFYAGCIAKAIVRGN